jgi:hypothetical protein
MRPYALIKSSETKMMKTCISVCVQSSSRKGCTCSTYWRSCSEMGLVSQKLLLKSFSCTPKTCRADWKIWSAPKYYRSSVVVLRTLPASPALFLPCLLLQQPGRSYGSTWTQASTCTHVKFTRSVKHICDRAQWRSYDRAEELTGVGTYVRIGGRIGHDAPGKSDLPLQYLRPCKISISIHCMNACNDT